MTDRPHFGLAGLVLTAATLLGGCCAPKPVPSLTSPYPYPRSLVVAPLMNHSPADSLDTLAATDILVAELSQVEGLTVLPTNRPLKLLAAEGRTHARSLEEAIALAQMLGADGVLVGAVTEYDPYKPMRIGMTLQLYWVRADMNSEVLDPTAMAQQPAPAPGYYSGVGPASQVQAVIDASRNEVTARVLEYAAWHQGQDSPYGPRRYLEDSEAFMHFVCYDMIVRLMDQELRRIAVPVSAE